MTLSHRAPRFGSLRSIIALILREMSTTYGRSPGGYIWAILEPVAAIGLFTLIFAYAFDAPPLGSSFGLFFATGFLPLMLYQSLANKVGQALQFSRPLLAYPRVKYMDAILARVILDVVTHILVATIILACLVLYEDLDIAMNFQALALGLSMTIALGLGVGLLNAFLMSMFPIWIFVWAVLNRPMFLVSGVLYMLEPLPEFYRDILLLNPVVHIVMQTRAGLYVVYDAVYASPFYVFCFAAVPALFGLIFLYRYHNDLLEA